MTIYVLFQIDSIFKKLRVVLNSGEAEPTLLSYICREALPDLHIAAQKCLAKSLPLIVQLLNPYAMY